MEIYSRSFVPPCSMIIESGSELYSRRANGNENCSREAVAVTGGNK